MKKILLMFVTLLAFTAVPAQTNKKTESAATSESKKTEAEAQPLKRAEGRITAPDAKVPVTEKKKKVNDANSTPESRRNAATPAAPGTAGASETPLDAPSNKSNQSPANNGTAAPTR